MKLRDAACEYADRGWAVMPLQPRGKAPLGRLVFHGMDDATSDLATVFNWWQQVPDANVGINCAASGLVVIDVDPRHGGDDELHDLERELGPLPRTVSALTGGGGAHHIFVDEQVSYRREIAPGVDIKAAGYIVAPPSVHPSGGRYEWEFHSTEALARLPEAWLERMVVKRRAETPSLNPEQLDPLKWVPARVYVAALAGRQPADDGWVTCPFHKGGKERTPSFKAEGTLWACYACEPIAGKSAMGGNIFDLAALLWDYGLPLSPTDYSIVRARLARTFA